MKIEKITNLSEDTYIVKKIYEININGNLTVLTDDDIYRIKRDEKELQTKIYELKLESGVYINKQILDEVENKEFLKNEQFIMIENSTGRILYKYNDYIKMIKKGTKILKSFSVKVESPRRPYTKSINIKNLFNRRYDGTTSKIHMYRVIADELGVSYKAIEKAVLKK